LIAGSQNYVPRLRYVRGSSRYVGSPHSLTRDFWNFRIAYVVKSKPGIYLHYSKDLQHPQVLGRKIQPVVDGYSTLVVEHGTPILISMEVSSSIHEENDLRNRLRMNTIHLYRTFPERMFAVLALTLSDHATILLLLYQSYETRRSVPLLAYGETKDGGAKFVVFEYLDMGAPSSAKVSQEMGWQLAKMHRHHGTMNTFLSTADR